MKLAWVGIPLVLIGIVGVPDEVVCRFGLELIFKTTDGSAACVKPTTAVKLI